MIFEKQDFQQQCVDNVINILKDFDFKIHNKEDLKKCLETFYSSSDSKNIPLKNFSSKLNIDILMETGTGKTFTYLNLIFELNKVYRQNKFIIFVPRKAILESVKQNIKLTKDYFYIQYGKHLRSYYNDSKSKSNIISHYIKNEDELSVLVLTNSSIDKADKNLLHKQNENLFGNESIFQKIISLKPICIIDEPHLLKGEKFYDVFKEFGTIHFRFGATFPKEESHKLSNLGYCLDSISAFNESLVKKINVHTLCKKNQAPSLISMDIKNKKAKFSYFLDNIEYQKEVVCGQDLGTKLYYPAFNGVELLKITNKDGAILSNHTHIPLCKNSYKLNKDQIIELMDLSINLHFLKEQELFKKGIKALSLFFIPDIESFRGKNPFIKNEFERIYKLKRAEILKQELSQDYREYLQKDFDSNGQLCVHQGYFSGDKGSSEEKEAQGVRLILEEKEKLLRLDTSLRFIFSVWALQEGWDNPNIFTLTKLASSSSEISRHQQIGRGLRLCVNNEGKRVTYDYLNDDNNLFYNINSLDVVVSGEEKGFIEGLQKEIEDSSFSFNNKTLDSNTLEALGLNKNESMKVLMCLEDAGVISEYDESSDDYKIISPIYEAIAQSDKIKNLLGNKFESILMAFEIKDNRHLQINNANKKSMRVLIRKNLAKEFKELWEYINSKSKIVYKNIDIQGLVTKIAKTFNEAKIHKDYVYIQTKTYDSRNNKIIIQSEKIFPQKDSKLDNFITQNIFEFSKKENLPLDFVMKVFNSLDYNYFMLNPNLALNVLKSIIKDEIHRNIIQSVSYDFDSQTSISSEDLLFYKDGRPKENIELYRVGRFMDEDITKANYLYEKCVYDSNIERETIKNSPFEINDKIIKVFAKLPKFSISTPYKSYEPDFAYLIEDKKGSKIFFVCETKGYNNESDIPKDEQNKIDYAKKFFDSLDLELKDKGIRVVFETKINKQKLIDVLQKPLEGNINDR